MASKNKPWCYQQHRLPFSGRESPMHPETTVWDHNQPAAGSAIPAALAATPCHDKGVGLVTIQPGRTLHGGNTTMRLPTPTGSWWHSLGRECCRAAPRLRWRLWCLNGMGWQGVYSCLCQYAHVLSYTRTYIHTSMHTDICTHTPKITE